MGEQHQLAEHLNEVIADECVEMTLYAYMARKTENRNLRVIFSSLSSLERLHAKRLEEMRDALFEAPASREQPVPWPIPEFLTIPRLQATLERIDTCRSEVQLVDTAIEFELEGMRYQMDVCRLLGETYGGIVKQLVLEEHGHVDTLKRIRQRLA